MSSISDKDKTREELLTELETLREELARTRPQHVERTSGELHAEAFFDNFHGACLEAEPALEGLNPFRNTVKVFQKLLENFPNGSINIFDRNLRYLFAAGQGLGEVGLFAEKLVGKSIFELYSPKDAEHAAAHYRLALEGQSVSFELPFHNRLYAINAAPLKDGSDNIYALIAVAQDVTERQQAAETLRALEQRAIVEYEHLLFRLTHLAETFGTARELPTIFRALRDFAFASMPCIGIFISLYDAARDERTARYAWGDDQEIDVSQLPPMPITAEGPNSRAVRTGQIIITDDYSKIRHGVATVPVGTDNGRLPLSSLVAPMSVMGRIVGTIEVQSYERGAYAEEHVTAMRMAANLAAVAIENMRLFEHESQARATAEESNRIKDEFLATLSHELRTPLTAVLGWARLLRDRELDEQTSQHALDIIERNARAQKQIIEDILDVSRIITGKTRLDVRPVELEPLIEAAIESVRPAAAAKEIDLQLVRAHEVVAVSGDAARLQQVVWNLLSNAVKFTPHGGHIEVRLSHEDHHARIEINDSGEGISRDFLPYVFDRFRQADGSSTRRHGGLGLGLAIVRHLVELHGGTVKAESKGENEGSTFIVNMPMLVDTMESETAQEQAKQGASGGSSTDERLPNLEGLRVLVVDDEPDALEYLRAVLERSRAEVTSAQSATEALASLESLRPDIIVSDIGMPDVDGYDFVRSLRALPAERGGSLPAIALTAYARSEDRLRALREGFQMHIPKPFEPSELVMIVASLTGRSIKKG